MSTLEERRAERRRRRQMEEEHLRNGTKTPDELHADIQERMEERRKKRQERLGAISSGFATVNGEDDLERRRRERREARLRQDTGNTDSGVSEDYSSRRSRRRGTEEDLEDPSSYSYRSARRNRTWDSDETTTTVNDSYSSAADTSIEDSALERRRRQRQEEEEEAQRQQQREEEERQQQGREEEERRQREEEERRRREQEEEERLRREEEEVERRRLEEQQRIQDEEDGRYSDPESETDSGKDSESGTDNETDNHVAKKLYIEEEDFHHDFRRRDEVPYESYEKDNKKKGSLEESRAVDISWKKIHISDSGSVVASEKTVPATVVEINNNSYSSSAGGSNKIREKLDKFEHLRDESEHDKEAPSAVSGNVGLRKEGLMGKLMVFEQEMRAQKGPASDTIGANVERVKDKPDMVSSAGGTNKEGLKGRLQKFEQEIKVQELSAKDPYGGHSHKPTKQEPVTITSPSQKLSAKLQQFESAAKSHVSTKPSTRNVKLELEQYGSKQDQRQNILGRWSASESQINKTEKEVPKKKVFDRWKSIEKQESPAPSPKTPTAKTEVFTKRLSGNTEFIATRFLEKASKSIDESVVSPRSATISHSENSSFTFNTTKEPGDLNGKLQMAGTQSDGSSPAAGNQSASKVITVIWPLDGGGMPRIVSPNDLNSRGSSIDNSHHSRGSSLDNSSETSGRYSQPDQEDEERLEAERLEREKEEQAARMAEEQQKKRGKRKGLGGLTPEKKKKLKDIVIDYDSEEEAEKQRVIAERLDPLPDDLDFISKAELKKLCAKLQTRLAQLHSEVYDWEYKIGKQDQEVTELTMKVNDSTGKFVKPVLRKVNKTEQKFAAISKKEKQAFRETLKSAHDEEQED